MSAPRIPGYAQVRLSDGTRRFIKIGRETDTVIAGFRVTKDGDKWGKETADAYVEELIVVTPKNVIKRMVLNTHYMELEDM